MARFTVEAIDMCERAAGLEYIPTSFRVGETRAKPEDSR